MNKRTESIVYFFLGIYTVMINWYFNQSIIDAIFTWLFWPIYLIYALLAGHLAHGQWQSIPNSYFK